MVLLLVGVAVFVVIKCKYVMVILLLSGTTPFNACSRPAEAYNDVSQYPMFGDEENMLEYFQAYANNYLEQAQLGDVNIWPETISENATVQDYTLVYAEPFDANYLGNLKIDYEREEYWAEIERLKNYPSTEYQRVYGAEGFSGYQDAAIDASDLGFVYALTDESTIIYVGMIFPGYGMDIDYKKYIPEEYLPEGLGATKDNPTRKAVIEGNEKTK